MRNQAKMNENKQKCGIIRDKIVLLVCLLAQIRATFNKGMPDKPPGCKVVKPGGFNESGVWRSLASAYTI